MYTYMHVHENVRNYVCTCARLSDQLILSSTYVCTVFPQIDARAFISFTTPPTRHLRVVGHGYCGALKECADLGFVVN